MTDKKSKKRARPRAPGAPLKAEVIHRYVGAPEKYEERFCELLKEHMRKGNSFWSFAAHDAVGVCLTTLDNWCKAHAAFLKARREGEALLLKHDEDMGKLGTAGQLRRLKRKITYKAKTPVEQDRVVEEYEAAQFAQNYHRFVMTNRYPAVYKDRRELAVSELPAPVADVADETLDDRIDKLLAKRASKQRKVRVS